MKDQEPDKVPADYEGKSFAEVLDLILFRDGHGSADELARELEASTDLNAAQIARRISAYRRDPDGARTFDLVCRVISSVPGMLEEVCRRVGLILVEEDEHDRLTGQVNLFRLLAKEDLEEARLQMVLARALDDEVVTPGEREEIRQALQRKKMARAAAEHAVETLAAREVR
jgi:hypothetical protein